MPRNPFRELTGIQVVEATDGRSLVRMPEKLDLTNARGVIHGGAICSLADSAIGTAVRSKLNSGDFTATIEMKVNFLAPARGVLEAEAKVVHVGGTTAVGEAEIRDSTGALVAKGLATFHVRRGAKPPRPGAQTALDPDMDGPTGTE